jgi:type 1 fimbria pilin
LNALNNDTAIQMNYGVGVKFQFHPRVGFRADVRGLVGPNANFGLPENPAAGTYIPKHYMQGVETTVGLAFYFGRKEKPEPPAPPPPPPAAPVVIPRHDMTGGSITASSTSVCPGEAVQLSSNASDPQGHRLSYQWSISGRSSGSNSSTFTFTPDQSGDYQIGLHVTDTASENAASAVDASGVSIHVKQYSRPTIGTVTATPADVERGGTITLHATGTGSECSGPLSYSWTASEGSVSGSGADASFNTGSVSFNEADRSRPQSKQIRFTATVSDSKGGTASGSATATVEFGAQTKHFGDIVFPKGSARVNNCGKRVLIEQLYPVLTSNSNYDVVLVGHIDAGEATPVRRKGAKARAARALDRERVLQTAAILSGGTGTCSALDRSRIRGSWVGTAQETESLPTSCAMSTTPVKERKGAEVGDSSEAKNRRVEIWLVPKGMALPSAAKDAKDLPDSEMTKIGCPK